MTFVATQTYKPNNSTRRTAGGRRDRWRGTRAQALDPPLLHRAHRRHGPRRGSWWPPRRVCRSAQTVKARRRAIRGRSAIAVARSPIGRGWQLSERWASQCLGHGISSELLTNSPHGSGALRKAERRDKRRSRGRSSVFPRIGATTDLALVPDNLECFSISSLHRDLMEISIERSYHPTSAQS